MGEFMEDKNKNKDVEKKTNSLIKKIYSQEQNSLDTLNTKSLIGGLFNFDTKPPKQPDESKEAIKNQSEGNDEK